MSKTDLGKQGYRIFVTVIVLLSTLYFGAETFPAIAQGAWYAEYFANRDLSGGPALTRYEGQLHFEWGSGGPGTGVPADNFAARWTRQEWFESGTYRFSYRSDDGIRIWVGDTLVVDDWRDREAAWTIVDHFIPRGTHPVRVEYYEHTGAASVQVSWERVSGGAAWRGEYFAHRDLSGAPALVRYDPAIDFDWGTGSPDPSIPADNFAVRWHGNFYFNPGRYIFYTYSDDGVRLYLDGVDGVGGKRLIDSWGPMRGYRSATVDLGEGFHTVQVEYFERTGRAHIRVWWR